MRKILLLTLCVVISSGAEASRRRSVRLTPVAPSLSFDFRLGNLGWEADFSDYSPLNGDLSLISDIRPVPAEVGSGLAFFISGANRADDLFMFLRRRLSIVDGIQPNQNYEVSYAITFASNAPSGCAGIGGAPGESVYLKAGASAIKPQASLIESRFTMNIDKGEQSSSGVHASVAGNVANGRMCDSGPFLFSSMTRSHTHTSTVRSSPAGDLWLIVGTDSGFEGTTSLYYQRIDVWLTPLLTP